MASFHPLQQCGYFIYSPSRANAMQMRDWARAREKAIELNRITERVIN
jgi:hypothetical protein